MSLPMATMYSVAKQNHLRFQIWQHEDRPVVCVFTETKSGNIVFAGNRDDASKYIEQYMKIEEA